MPTAIRETTEPVWFFGNGDAEGGRELVDLLGGKGAHLHEMSRLGIPVPPGFTISTDACRHVTAHEGSWPDGLEEAIRESVARVERAVGKRFGDPRDPLLFSVRSGAPTSMPGMMDTVLNIGLNAETLDGLAVRMGDPRAAWDSYRRFLQMYGNVVAGIDGAEYENRIERKLEERKVTRDTDLAAGDWKELAREFREVYWSETGEGFPDDPWEQLVGAIDAVFLSWENPRAVTYREIHGLPHRGGTAANVQSMVFGNLGRDSATGVAFTRDPATGERTISGEWLANAQGEDIVSGLRTPHPLSRHDAERSGSRLTTFEEAMPELYGRMEEIFATLERHYAEMQDVEFTVERGTLYILQTRTGKRTAAAMVRIAHDMANEGLIDRREAIRRMEVQRLEELLHPTIDPESRAERSPIAVGLGASPGSASGEVVFDADRAASLAAEGRKVLLVRRETVADDIGGMHASNGVLTSRGGATSHAAVVARGMGRPCIVGCGALSIDYARRCMRVKDRTIREGDWLTLDGATGEVFEGKLDTVPARMSAEFGELMEWADGFRRLEVRANADTADDAARAREFGARGIGLCRTEHMFFEARRIQRVREMILLAPEVRRLRMRRDAGEIESSHERLVREERSFHEAIEALLPEQRADFEAIFETMEGLPVTIRLLDPPLHEFLPRSGEEREVLARSLRVPREEVDRKIDALTELNPMLGHRGCRLGLTYPEVYEMQTRAILEAALSVAARGIAVEPEIMVPLVATREELARLRERIEAVADAVLAESEASVAYRVGTMIELPRAALTADAIAEVADFFSFGTNDLTQTTYGLSRDDAAGFLEFYRASGILPTDPFSVLDRDGVGALIETAIEKGRTTRPDLGLGLCGEHGGDPPSVALCDALGLDYVSCSAFRVPLARLAAAQAALDQNSSRCSPAEPSSTSPIPASASG